MIKKGRSKYYKDRGSFISRKKKFGYSSSIINNLTDYEYLSLDLLNNANFAELSNIAGKIESIISNNELSSGMRDYYSTVDYNPKAISKSVEDYTRRDKNYVNRQSVQDKGLLKSNIVDYISEWLEIINNVEGDKYDYTKHVIEGVGANLGGRFKNRSKLAYENLEDPDISRSYNRYKNSSAVSIISDFLSNVENNNKLRFRKYSIEGLTRTSVDKSFIEAFRPDRDKSGNLIISKRSTSLPVKSNIIEEESNFIEYLAKYETLNVEFLGYTGGKDKTGINLNTINKFRIAQFIKFLGKSVLDVRDFADTIDFILDVLKFVGDDSIVANVIMKNAKDYYSFGSGEDILLYNPDDHLLLSDPKAPIRDIGRALIYHYNNEKSKARSKAAVNRLNISINNVKELARRRGVSL